MNWKEYENLTRWIYETIGQAHGVVIEGHGKDCKVVGKSGDKHQIDVLASHSDGFHKYLTDIECKYWNDNVDKDVFSYAVITLLKLMAPVCVHLTEELYNSLGAVSSIHLEKWPQYDENLTHNKTFTLVIQVNGKIKDKVQASIDDSEKELENIALKILILVRLLYQGVL